MKTGRRLKDLHKPRQSRDGADPFRAPPCGGLLAGRGRQKRPRRPSRNRLGNALMPPAVTHPRNNAGDEGQGPWKARGKALAVQGARTRQNG